MSKLGPVSDAENSPIIARKFLLPDGLNGGPGTGVCGGAGSLSRNQREQN